MTYNLDEETKKSETTAGKENSAALTFQVAGLRVPEIGGEILQALCQGRDHVSQEPLFLFGAVTTTRLQTRHSSLASMEHLQQASHE